jgi:tetratricopeptide (TPR) repeat protein
MDLTDPPRRAPRRLAVKLCVAALAPVVFLAAAELACALFGARVPRYFGSGPGIAEYWVPSTRPSSAAGLVRAFPRSNRLYPEPDPLFLRVKPANGYRLFVLGESSVQGLPYEIGSFCDWLRVQLRAMLPGRAVEVVNAGNAGWHAREIRLLLQESLRHAPDAVVWMVGHNEMVAQNVLAIRRELTNPAWSSARELLFSLRTTHVLSSLTSNFALTRRATLHDQSPSDYRPCFTPAELARIEERFLEATRGAVRDCKAAGVPIVLCTMPKNLRQSPPSGSHVSEALRQDRNRLARYEFQVQSAAEALAAGRADEALDILRAAEAQEALYAKLHFLRAQALEALGRAEEARASYVKALELDVCPMRAPAWAESAIRRVALDEDVPLVDLEGRFNTASPLGLAGDEWICDNVHPNLIGHEKIAETLLYTFEARLGLSLDRAREVERDAARAEIGLDRYERLEAAKSECLANFVLALEAGTLDAQWRLAREQCLQVLTQNPSDHEVKASLGLLEAMAGNAVKARELVEAAMASDDYVRITLVYQNIANAPYQRALEKAGVDIASVERRLTPAERRVLDNRLERAGLK